MRILRSRTGRRRSDTIATTVGPSRAEVPLPRADIHGEPGNFRHTRGDCCRDRPNWRSATTASTENRLEQGALMSLMRPTTRTIAALGAGAAGLLLFAGAASAHLEP